MKTFCPVDEYKRTILYVVGFTFNHGINKLSEPNDAKKSVFIPNLKK